MEFLVFHLHGPMASWGDIAVGEVRPSFGAPTRSALLGLLGACLGTTRDDTEGWKPLQEQLRFAVRVEHQGSRLDEYQTISLPEGRGHEHARTRRVEEEHSRENTMQTYREHYTDAIYTVFVHALDGNRALLERLESALKRPVFTPYLGRKANPLDIPMTPRFIKASSLGQALVAEPTELPSVITQLFKGTNVLPMRHGQQPRRVVADAHFDAWPWLSEEQRKNEPLARDAWNFSTNMVRVGFDIEPQTTEA